jgi:adenosylmethionine-8-amino-7-oxononanoate aminotransferase
MTEDEYSVFWRNLTDPPLIIDSGEGVYLYDEEGNEYLDAASGAAVCALGHGNSEIANVMKEQAEKLNYTHTSDYASRPLIEFSERLASISPEGLTKVHPVSGGSESNETAIKLARTYHKMRGESERYKIVSRSSSYHGATLGALSLSGKTSRQRDYAPMMTPNPKITPAYCYRCPFGETPDSCSLECADDLERAIVQEGEETVSGFIAEPVSGASAPGVHPPDEYWERVREICDKYGILLIVDEVMSGMGRTGKWWGINHSNVEPDMLCSSKGLGSGYTPLGAVVIHDKIYRTVKEADGSFNHGFTYEGNPISSAVGSKIIEIMERDGLVDRAAALGDKLLARLKESLGNHPNVGEIRGRGLLVGVEFVRDKSTKEPFGRESNLPVRIREAGIEHGLHVYPGGSPINGVWTDHVMLAPPFTITEDHVDEMVSSLRDAVDEVI